MAHEARETSISRRSWLLAGLAFPLSVLSRASGNNSISVKFDGDNLRATAPNLHFLTGKTLDRLKNANTVVFVANLRSLPSIRAILFAPPTRGST